MSFTSTPFNPDSGPASSPISGKNAVRPRDVELLEDAERALFDHLMRDCRIPSQAPVLFVVGSPRTGSTLFYQALVRAFRLPYFCNLANDVLAALPVLAAPILQQAHANLDIAFTSAFGKTLGALQPSEGSEIIRRWCGGGHPSQVTSTQVLPEKRDHMAKTLAAYYAVFGRPIVIKNAWNCFRIQSLAELFPNAYFLWIRRDITKSSLSDLAARYVVQGDPNVWNSATPARLDELKKLPYWAQVVENQYEFSQAIDESLSRFAPQKHAHVWYEDFLSEPHSVLDRLSYDLQTVHDVQLVETPQLQPVERSPRPFHAGDEDELKRYVEKHQSRFQPLRYAA